jgi:hypothetical protein
MIEKHQANQGSSNQEEREQNKQYINMDIAEELGHFDKMARTRFHRVSDWQIRDLGMFEAWRTQ